MLYVRNRTIDYLAGGFVEYTGSIIQENPIGNLIYLGIRFGAAIDKILKAVLIKIPDPPSSNDSYWL